MSSIVIDGASFQRAYDAVEHAAARAEDRPILTAILLEIDDEGARLVAADNYRISVCDLSLLTGFEQRVRLPIRRTDLAPVRKTMTKKTDSVTFTVESETRVVVAWDSYSVVLQPISGTYPNYSQVFPDESPTVALDARFLGDLRFHKRWLATEPFVVHVTGPERPVVFTAPGRREAIMPVRGVVDEVDGLPITSGAEPVA